MIILCVQKSIEIDPDYGEVYFNYGNLLSDAGNVEAAAARYSSRVFFCTCSSNNLWLNSLDPYTQVWESHPVSTDVRKNVEQSGHNVLPIRLVMDVYYPRVSNPWVSLVQYTYPLANTLFSTVYTFIIRPLERSRGEVQGVPSTDTRPTHHL